MKKFLFLLFALLSFNKNSFGQKKEQDQIDSLLVKISKEKPDSIKLYLYSDLIFTYVYFDPLKGLQYEAEALNLATKLNWKPGIALIKLQSGRCYWRLGKFENALRNHMEALKIYENTNRKESIGTALTFIGQDYGDSGNYPEARKYFLQALKIYEEIGNESLIADIYGLLSWVNSNEGNVVESSKNNFEALRIYEKLGNEYASAISMSNLGGDYQTLGNSPEALKYFMMTIKPLMEENDKVNLSTSYNSIGNIYLILGNSSMALKYQDSALAFAKEMNDNFCIGQSYKGKGDVYTANGNYKEALNNYLLSVEMFKSISNKQQLTDVYNKIGTCYVFTREFEKANKYFSDAFILAQELGSKMLMMDYYRGVEQLDSTKGNWKSAYFNNKYYITGKDSILGMENTKKLVQAQMQYDSDKREAIAKAEQDKKDVRQRTIRNSISAGLAGALIFLVVVYRQRNKISKAKKRSDELLLNILPAETAEELKNTGTAKAKQHNHVTVLFTDFKNFTAMSEKLSAQELVREINFCYSTFDGIITKYGIEKIKTIGDSYMCASGLPLDKATHAIDAVNAAMEISQFIENEKQKRSIEGLPFFEIRIGLNSGPVVAGIVGIKKFAYDIWGDTVNIASRMESSGEVGKVNISGSTYELVKNKFKCIHREKIQVKNKGEVDMYFVENLK